MSETAAFVVEEILPKAPVRQWVMSFPMELRFMIARDAKVYQKVKKIYLSAIRDYYVRKGRILGGRDIQTGYINVLQYSGGYLNLVVLQIIK